MDFFRWWNVLWFALLTWFISGAPIDDVEKMIAHFKDLSDPASDMLSNMGRLGSKIAPFVKVAFPIGGLVAGALQVAGQTTSDEYKALTMLNHTMTTQFQKIADTVEFAVKVIRADSHMLLYETHVRTPLDILKSEMEMMWNPRLNKTQAVIKMFKDNCHKYNPKHLLIFIKGMTVRACRRPTQRDALISAKAREIFRQIEKYSIVNVGYTSDYMRRQFETDKQSVIHTLCLISSFIADQLLVDIQWAFTTKVWSMADAMKAIKTVFVNRGVAVTPSSCFTESVIEASDYGYLAANEFVELIVKDMARAITFAGSCANLTFEGYEPAITLYQKQVRDLMIDITSYTDEYIHLKLETAWPSIHEVVIKKMIGESTISPSLYQETVKNLTTKVASTGLPNYYYQLLLTTYEDAVTGIESEGDPKFLLTMSKLGGTDLVVSRFLKQDLYRMIKAQKWLSSKRDDIYTVIDKNYNIGRLDNLLQRIKTGIHFNLTSETLYGSVAITRDYSLIQGNCQVVFGHTIHVIPDVGQASDYLEYYWRGEPIFKNCEHFLLFFFL